VRTRSAAAGLATGGHVRVNGQRIDAPGRAVRLGDVVTVALDHSVRVLKVRGFVLRRGSADTARNLYDDLAPAPARPAEPAPAPRETGSGRPTKRERRAIDQFTGREES
jgi:ribosome-associated heat shock protein Hsp15